MQNQVSKYKLSFFENQENQDIIKDILNFLELKDLRFFGSVSKLHYKSIIDRPIHLSTLDLESIPTNIRHKFENQEKLTFTLREINKSIQIGKKLILAEKFDGSKKSFFNFVETPTELALERNENDQERLWLLNNIIRIVALVLTVKAIWELGTDGCKPAIFYELASEFVIACCYTLLKLYDGIQEFDSAQVYQGALDWWNKEFLENELESVVRVKKGA